MKNLCFYSAFLLSVRLSNLPALPSASIIVIASEESVSLRTAAQVCWPARVFVRAPVCL